MSSFNQIIAGPTPVLVDFFAEWCGPCKMMAPVLKNLAGQMQGKLRIIKIDVDKNQTLAAQLGIQGVPTLVLYKGGQAVWRQSGAMPEHQLAQVINQYL